MVALTYQRGVEKKDFKSKSKFLKLKRDNPITITLYKGTFSERGQKLKGSIYHIMRNGYFSPGQDSGGRLENSVDVSKLARLKNYLFYEGEMERYELSSGLDKQVNYRPSKTGGNLNLKRVLDKGKISHFKDNFYLVELEKKNKKKKTKISFRGLVRLDKSYRYRNVLPILGEYTDEDGEVYEGALRFGEKFGFGVVRGKNDRAGFFVDGELIKEVKSENIPSLYETLKKIQKGEKVTSPWTVKSTNLNVKSSGFKNSSQEEGLFWGKLNSKSDPALGSFIIPIETKYESYGDLSVGWFNNLFKSSRGLLFLAGDVEAARKGNEDIFISLDGYRYVHLVTMLDSKKNEVNLEGCANFKSGKKLFQGHFPLGWRYSESDKELRYRLDHDRFKSIFNNKFYYSEELSSLDPAPAFIRGKKFPSDMRKYFDESIQLLNVAEKDSNFCSEDITPARIGKFLGELKTTIAIASQKIKTRDKQNREAIKRAQEYARTKKPKAAKPCPKCHGSGQLYTTEKNTTKFVPRFKYRNGLKITTTTKITTKRKRWTGVCPLCHGSGEH